MLYHLRLKGNGAHMIGSCDEVDPASGVPTCATCGYRTDPDFTNPGFRMRRRRLDLSCCYDGAVIVSDRFRALYATLGGSNLRFVDLPKAPGFHHLTCITPVALDYAAMGTQCLRLCAGCGLWAAAPSCSLPARFWLAMSWPLPTGISARTTRPFRCWYAARYWPKQWEPRAWPVSMRASQWRCSRGSSERCCARRREGGRFCPKPTLVSQPRHVGADARRDIRSRTTRSHGDRWSEDEAMMVALHAPSTSSNRS